eukprot:TRINITY_DN22112_c0_g1_i1.p2 TRINITY_DN22112_c0_g1~~TRINITY_DN22112_c0_g1_i1.p2  ORF type:complete len:133 (-),score=22.68 TRINITY_DN22112_c0_g1_i1:229-627(-)
MMNVHYEKSPACKTAPNVNEGTTPVVQKLIGCLEEQAKSPKPQKAQIQQLSQSSVLEAAWMHNKHGGLADLVQDPIVDRGNDASTDVPSCPGMCVAEPTVPSKIVFDDESKDGKLHCTQNPGCAAPSECVLM